jgi:hypothetical protein
MLLGRCLCFPAVFTNDTVIGYGDPAYEHQEITISNCVLTVDGPHEFASFKVLQGGTLTHSAYVTGVIPTSRAVTGEVMVLRLESASPTFYPVVETNSVLVRDLSGAITYTNGVDYVLGFTNTHGWIQLLPNSSISDGSTNAIDYLAPSSEPAGFQIVVSGDVHVAAGGQINVDAKGYGSGYGPGKGVALGSPPAGSGGTYGGIGGAGLGVSITMPSTYGDPRDPKENGSSGGMPNSTSPGGSGGGRVLLEVGGTLQIDGRITADGGNSPGYRSGGGSGGSISLKANVLAGTGKILARGGHGDPGQGGGGSGGRIALNYGASFFAGEVSAAGGPGYQDGGPGTIYSKATANAHGDLTFDNNGRPGNSALLEQPGMVSLMVRNGASVLVRTMSFANVQVGTGAHLNANGAILTVSSNVVVDFGGRLTADGGGYPAGQGPGAGRGTYSITGGLNGGGGYGGFGGGANSSLAQGGQAYGTYAAPVQQGSGGGSYNLYLKNPGGAGGGVIRLNVSGTLICNGRISANGDPGIAPGGGGGAGGSILLVVGTLAGGGVIATDGGPGDGFGLYAGGGGGGGRIVIEPGMDVFFGTTSACGGEGFVYGGAGTVYTKLKSQPAGLLIADNGGNMGTNTLHGPLGISTPPASYRVAGGAKLAGNISTSYDVFVGSNSWVLGGITAANVTIEQGGGVDLDGMGDRENLGSGRGGAHPAGCGGAGHGGFGGAGAGGGFGGNVYGTPLGAYYRGSGGGSYGPSYGGGAGGGNVVVNATGLLRVDGSISANGQNATNAIAGGGSGGGVEISAGTFAGGGRITANGGNGGTQGGGGGGGRISITYGTDLFSGSVTAFGGGGFSIGGAGTILMRKNQSAGQLLVDNGGFQGTNTSWSSGTYELVIRNGGIVAPFGGQTLAGLTLGSGGWIYVSNQTLTVSGSMTIEAGAGIRVVGGTGARPGGSIAVPSVGLVGGGGGYGGSGANPDVWTDTALGGASYGQIIPAGESGSAGAGGYNGIGGAGGGSLTLNVSGHLTVDGTITADGSPGPTPGAGGGSGGALILNLKSLSGTGRISADGGNGNSLGGGGGGGRIQLIVPTNLFEGRLSAFGGGPAKAAGGAGTIYMSRDGYRDSMLLVDNGGLKGTNTVFPIPVGGLLDLVIRNGASVFQGGSYLNLNSLVIGPDARMTIEYSKAYLTVSRDINIEPGGVLSADQTGYSIGNGPGAGITKNGIGSGAGHGGSGGASSMAQGGFGYGFATQPSDPGSGGGTGYGPLMGGSKGGGALRVMLYGTFKNNGLVSANGGGALQDSAGGGSGGSIWVDAGALVGNGTFAAMGGDGELFFGGGGAGGRIAIYTRTNFFTGNVSVAGGNGYARGADGTLFQSATPLPLSVIAQTPGGTLNSKVSEVLVLLDTPVLASSLSASAFTLLTPAGPLDATNISVQLHSSDLVKVQFPAQELEGIYTFTFGPEVRNLHMQLMSQTYTGAFTIAWPVVQGRVVDHLGQPVSGVILTGTTSAQPVPTDATGSYSIKCEPDQDVTISPAKQGLAFDPPSIAYERLNVSLSGVDFVGLPAVHLTGNISMGPAPGIELEWQGTKGLTYRVYWSTNLLDWEPADTLVTCRDSGERMMLKMPLDDGPRKFFKLQTNCSGD